LDDQAAIWHLAAQMVPQGRQQMRAVAAGQAAAVHQRSGRLATVPHPRLDQRPDRNDVHRPDHAHGGKRGLHLRREDQDGVSPVEAPALDSVEQPGGERVAHQPGGAREAAFNVVPAATRRPRGRTKRNAGTARTVGASTSTARH
jgi:hypothetical protein